MKQENDNKNGNKDHCAPSAHPGAEEKPTDPGRGDGGDSVVEIEESQLKKIQQEASEFKDKYIRLYAEFENTRRRMEREKLEYVRFANENLIIEFLSVLDDLERSVQAASQNHQDYAAFLKGVEMVMAHIYELLKKNDVKAIEAVGKTFDPHCHEVLMQVESDQQKDHAVVEEFQKGYLMGGKVIRTSKVKVAVRPRQQETPE